jgi:putative glutamine amidotransferase
MPNLATWIRRKDAKSFRPIFAKHPEIKVWNALDQPVRLEKMDGLLLTGGSDISPEFLRQENVDPLLLDKAVDPERDRWEFEAAQEALSRGLPIFAICKGLQVFNVALGGTLKLDIKGHNLPDQRDREVQALRHACRASHRFSKVNSAHHQAIERLGDDLEVEAWSAHDGIIEQIYLRKYPFARAVQYHPERSRVYDALFEEFFDRINKSHRVTAERESADSAHSA